jgi:apolipoprotein N-acyltransferase
MRLLGLVLGSALLYSGAFLAPSIAFWMVVPALALLFLASEYLGIGFWQGLLWGAVVWGPHDALVFWSFAPLVGAWWVVLLGWLVITGYLALHAGLCGWFLRLVREWVSYTFLRFGAYTLVLSAYFWWMSSAVFWPFDYWEGYLLLDPLTPWGAVLGPWLQAPLVWMSLLGWSGARLLLLAYAALWAALVCAWRCRLLVVRVLGLLVFTVFLLVPGLIMRDQVPAWVPAIGVVHAGFERERLVHEPTHTARLVQAIERLVTAHPAVVVVVTPESAFPFCCSEYPESCAVLQKASAGRLLMLASNRYAGALGTDVCNTSFAFQPDGTVVWYDKTHCMFYAERVPGFLTALGLHDLVVSWIGYEFVPGTCRYPVFPVSPILRVRPCLCSELFFTDCLAHDPDQLLPVAAQVNDAWYPGTPIPELLWAVARLKACAYGRVIIYASYTRAAVLLPHGGCAVLPFCNG